jgi:hypothetical protein
MSKENYNNQSITAYLLGTLAETETERFDELSLTDANFADALDAAEKDLVDAYARGELSSATLENFETHYLASPLRREKVEFAKTFQMFAERRISEANREKSVEKAKTKKSSAGFFSVFNNLIKNKLLRFGFAAAALLFLIFAGLWLFGNRPAQPQIAIQDTPVPVAPRQIESPQPEIANVEKEIAATENENDSPPKTEKEANKNVSVNRNTSPQKVPKITVASFVLAPSLRGANQITNFPISGEIVSVAVRLELEANDYPSYRVRLADESGSGNLWSSGVLRAQEGKGENKFLTVQFPAKILKSQIYLLVVSGVTGSEEEILTSYPFRAVIK